MGKSFLMFFLGPGGLSYVQIGPRIQKGWLAIATLNPTFTFLGRDFTRVCDFSSPQILTHFPFGTENQASQKDLEGWLVEVWDGNSWDPSHQY